MCLPLPAAAEPAFNLSWEAPPGCPDSVAVRASIAAWLVDRDLALAGRVEIEADVDASSEGYVLDLALRAGSAASHERVESRDCGVFVDMIGLKASLMAAPAPESERAEPAEKDGVAATGATAVPQRGRPERSLPAPPPWFVRVAGSFGSSPLWDPGYALQLTGGYRASAWLALELAVGYALPTERRYPRQPDAGGRMQALVTGLRGCAIWPLPRLELRGCAGVELATLRGRGLGVMDTRTTDQLWLGLTAGPGIHVPLHRAVALALSFELPISLTSPEFFVHGLGTLHRPDKVGWRGNLGIEWRLP